MKFDKYFRRALINTLKPVGIWFAMVAYIGTIVALIMNGAVWSSVIAVLMVLLVASTIVMLVANEEANHERRWEIRDED